MNPIPPLDLKTQYETIKSDVDTAVLSVLASGQYIKGEFVERFEAEFSHYSGTSFCVACNSGSDALFLALRAFDIGPGDEVITSPFTFIATAEMISAVGATPIFVDIEPNGFNIDCQAIADKITPRTRAIIPVHLFGQPAQMSLVMDIARAHNLVVIEDCAQATGATWQGQRVGSIGHVGCFSFYPTKNLGAFGDGGAITTQDQAIANKIRVLADHGRKQGYYHEAIGVNSRLDALQAAILSVKLKHLDQWNTQRTEVASRYSQLLAPVPGIQLPQTTSEGQSVWNQYTIRIPQDPTSSSSETSRRDNVRRSLKEKHIGSAVYYPLPLHLQPVYQHLQYQPGDLPRAEKAADEVLSLPMFPELTLKQQETVMYALKDISLNA
ncbi:MAG: DegT/DnrJ/EryC1/StrS family aminotransferase [Leptolyngbyaceae bacterium]|nr:DegT/DnrJ/EryC1/StrS family aminotransferase [Leptolyngbyaceae bacterium]